MALPNINDLIGAGVTEAGFKSALQQFLSNVIGVDQYNANALITPVILTNTQDLNLIKASGIYVARNLVPALVRNYPTTEAGIFIPWHVLTGSTGTLIPQLYLSFSGKIWIRGTNSAGDTYTAWDQIGSKTLIDSWIATGLDTSKAPKNLATDYDLYTLTKTDLYLAYSNPTTPTSTTHMPTAGEQYFIDFFVFGSVKRMIAYARGSNNVYTAWYWGTFGWSQWVKFSTETDLLNVLNSVDAISIFREALYTKLNGFNSVKMKFIGDSITWGVGASNTSATEPRTGYLTDPRNTTSPTSPTWVNLFRQYIATAVGDTTINEDAPGSAYAIRPYVISFKQELSKFSFKTATGTALSGATASEGISVQSNSNGEALNLLGLNFPSARQNEFSFDIISDNISILYRKWGVGDTNDKVEVYVDGILAGSFNYYDSVQSWENVFSTTFAYGKHTIRVKNVATHADSYAHIQCCRTNQKIWVINDAIIGSSTATWLDRSLFENTLNQYDDFVFMMLGTNDRATVGGESGFRSRLRTCVDKVKTLAPNAKLCLLTSAYASGTNETNPVYNFKMRIVDQVISTVAQEKYLPHISNFKYTSVSRIEGPNIFDPSDSLHPNDAGNKLMYENIRKQLFKV